MVRQGRKGQQGKEHDISHCFRLERKGWRGKEGKDNKEMIVKKECQGYDVKDSKEKTERKG